MDGISQGASNVAALAPVHVSLTLIYALWKMFSNHSLLSLPAIPLRLATFSTNKTVMPNSLSSGVSSVSFVNENLGIETSTYSDVNPILPGSSHRKILSMCFSDTPFSGRTIYIAIGLLLYGSSITCARIRSTWAYRNFGVHGILIMGTLTWYEEFV